MRAQFSAHFGGEGALWPGQIRFRRSCNNTVKRSGEMLIQQKCKSVYTHIVERLFAQQARFNILPAPFSALANLLPTVPNIN